jgi:hypothetical protein
MANRTIRQGNEAIPPMGKSTVPVLFSLKNVQPLILAASPASPSKDKTPTIGMAKASVASPSALASSATASSEPNKPAFEDTVVLSRPTKVPYGGQILRTVGTVLLILLVIVVVRMSVPVGSKDAKIAAQNSASDASADQQKTTKAEETSTSQVIVPPLPELVVSPADVRPKDESMLLSPSHELERGLSGGEANLHRESSSVERESFSAIELNSSPVPTLLAAAPAPTPPSPVDNPDFPKSLQVERPVVPWPSLSESNATERNETVVQPYTNAPAEEVPPYTPALPELHSANDVRETSTPNLDSMADLITLYRNARGNTESSSNIPARQVPSGSSATQAQTTSFAPQSPTPYIPTTPYAPLSSATNWPTSPNAIPSSQVGSVTRSDALPTTAPVNNNSLPMSGQSYPPSQKTYEPLTVPAYEQPSNASGLSQNGMNRYQATLIRQPDGGSSVPITQPKQPYTPVGPTATGTTGASFGYPPINVPSN